MHDSDVNIYPQLETSANCIIYNIKHFLKQFSVKIFNKNFLKQFSAPTLEQNITLPLPGNSSFFLVFKLQKYYYGRDESGGTTT